MLISFGLQLGKKFFQGFHPVLFGDATPNENNCKYVGTFTILPIVSAEEGKLEKDVYMHVEITESIADKIRAGQNINVLFEPVQVRGRNIPDEPLEINDIIYEFVV